MDVLVWAALLASPDFAVRDAGSRLASRLDHQDPTLGAVALVGDPEAGRRAEEAAAIARRRLLAAMGPFPQLDMGWHRSDIESRNRGAFERALDFRYVPSMRQKAADCDAASDGYPYTKLRMACREWVDERLEAGEPPALLAAYVDILRSRDQAYYRGTGMKSPYRLRGVD